MHSNTSRALVTGASSGLGAALAQRLAAHGCEVWLAARRMDLLDANVRAIRAAGGRAHALMLDVGDCDTTVERLTQLDRDCGGMDMVIASAGIAGMPAAIPISRASWANSSAILRVNLCGAVASFVPFIPGMLQRGHGHLVGISSIAAEFPNPRTPMYGAAKAGLSFALKAIDMELRPRGVPVTIVEPGFVRTAAAEGVTEPMPFILETDAAVERIERAIRQRARMVRFPWQWTMLLRGVARLPASLSGPLIRRFSAEPAPAATPANTLANRWSGHARPSP